MYLSFESRSLRKICENKEEAINLFGEEVAAKLHARLADLFAIKTVFELSAGKPDKFSDFPFKYFKIDLTDHFRLLFCANHPKNPYLQSGDIDWTKVNRIKITNIIPKHE